jgi:hypothetical protein
MDAEETISCIRTSFHFIFLLLQLVASYFQVSVGCDYTLGMLIGFIQIRQECEQCGNPVCRFVNE